MTEFGSNDLVLTADETFTHTFTRAGGWTNRLNRLQMRTPYGNELLIELSVFLTLDADPTKINLVIPGTLTGKLAPEGRYDLLSVGVDPDDTDRLPSPPGRLLVLQGATSRL